MSWNDLRVAAPMLWIALAVLGLLLRPRRVADRGWRGGFVLALGGLSFAFVHLAWLWQTGAEPEAVSSLLMADRYGLFLSGVVLVSAAVALVSVWTISIDAEDGVLNSKFSCCWQLWARSSLCRRITSS